MAKKVVKKAKKKANKTISAGDRWVILLTMGACAGFCWWLWVG